MTDNNCAPLVLNMARTNKQSSHYERSWSPTQFLDPLQPINVDNSAEPTVHTRGFAPSVYRHPTRDEYTADAETSYNPVKHSYISREKYIEQRRACVDGYRKKCYVIGLTNLGYFDIDEVKQPSDTLLIPTVLNVSHALKQAGYWHYVHPSASRAEGKIRIIYRRDLTVYSNNHYNPETYTWNLEPDTLGTIRAVRDNGQSVLVDNDLQLVTINILHAEMTIIKNLLAEYNINSSGLDHTSLDTHMHSKHLTKNGDAKGDEAFADGKGLIQWT